MLLVEEQLDSHSTESYKVDYMPKLFTNGCSITLGAELGEETRTFGDGMNYQHCDVSSTHEHLLLRFRCQNNRHEDEHHATAHRKDSRNGVGKQKVAKRAVEPQQRRYTVRQLVVRQDRRTGVKHVGQLIRLAVRGSLKETSDQT